MHVVISYAIENKKIMEEICTYLNSLIDQGLLSTWKTWEIVSGEKSEAMPYHAFPDVWIPLLSPHFLALMAWNEESLQKALHKQRKGELVILPVIIETCNWASTMFNDLRVLQNKKPIIRWLNRQQACEAIFQHIRQILSKPSIVNEVHYYHSSTVFHENYWIPGESISLNLEKWKFIKNSFEEIKWQMKEIIDKSIYLLNLEAINHIDTDFSFEMLIRGRNNGPESLLQIHLFAEKLVFSPYCTPVVQIAYDFENKIKPSGKIFMLSGFHQDLFWILNKSYCGLNPGPHYDSFAIAKTIWIDWLQRSVIL